jgi:hypothetical protein
MHVVQHVETKIVDIEIAVMQHPNSDNPKAVVVVVVITVVVNNLNMSNTTTSHLNDNNPNPHPHRLLRSRRQPPTTPSEFFSCTECNLVSLDHHLCCLANDDFLLLHLQQDISS